jgi:hypothetical protein
MNEPKCGQRHDRKAGRAYGLRAEAFLCLDFIHFLFVFYRCSLSRYARSFGPFLYQDKKGLASAAIERRVY